jgi:hypothetical protein
MGSEGDLNRDSHCTAYRSSPFQLFKIHLTGFRSFFPQRTEAAVVSGLYARLLPALLNDFTHAQPLSGRPCGSYIPLFMTWVSRKTHTGPVIMSMSRDHDISL